MIVDAPVLERYDVVIIGTGPAGLPAALRLAEQTSLRIALIESGMKKENDSIQDLSAVTATGDMSPGHWAFHAQRTFGGTSNAWGGWCAALERRAFDLQEWPIEYDEIDRYYPDAAEVLNASPNVYMYKEAEIESAPGLVYKPFYTRFPVRLEEKYWDTIATHPTIDLILQATCVELEHEGSTITQAVLTDSLGDGSELSYIKADYFILACGGIGNPRVLHHSNIAKDSPVGRHLMEHPHVVRAAKVYLNEERLRQYTVDEPDVVHALQLSSERCVEEGLLSFSFSFDLHQTAEKPLLGRSKNVVVADVVVRAEMEPQFDNAVSLSDEVDGLGQRRAHVNFHYNHDDLAWRTWQILTEELLRSGFGRPAPFDASAPIGGGGHYIGTTRMGTSELDSVVDGDCKVHATDNLFIAGSSVFPAAGVANPTYTIVALSLRLADHIAALKEGV